MPRPLVLGAFLAAAVLLTGCTAGSNDPSKEENQQGYIGGQLVTRIAPADRTALPAVSGTALGTQKPISTADYAGKVVVLNVWGSWCNPCRAEATDLQAASAATTGTSQFLGVDVQEPSEDKGMAFVRAKGITYPSIYDPSSQTLLELAGLKQITPSAIPSTLVIDRQGRVAVRVLGTISKLTLIDMITDTAAGK